MCQGKTGQDMAKEVVDFVKEKYVKSWLQSGIFGMLFFVQKSQDRNGAEMDTAF